MTTHGMSDDELDAKMAELERVRDTAEQEVLQVQEIQETVQSRWAKIFTLSDDSRVRRFDNHFARDYEITMRTKHA